MSAPENSNQTDLFASDSSVEAAITPAQLELIQVLLGRKDLAGGQDWDDERHSAAVASYRESASKMSKRQASNFIDILRKLDYRKRRRFVPNGLTDVPAGRYLIEAAKVHGVVDGPSTEMYRVDKPTDGRWAGRTFVSRLDPEHPTKRGIAIRESLIRNNVLSAIAQDVAGAAESFGRKTGTCGICGRTLTDEASIARGIGPVCAEKVA